MDANQSKKELRRSILSIRDGLSQEEHQRLSAVIVKKLMAEPLIIHAQTILSYQPFRSEVNIAAFNTWALQEGKTLAFPVSLEERRMVAAVPHGSDPLFSGKFGIRSPDPQMSRIIQPEDLDCVLIPCVGFNDEGYRLGMGGGYYDRYLKGCSGVTKLGVAFSLQKTDRGFQDPWDIALDSVFTEA